MTPSRERFAIVVTPVLAMATFAVGLRVGAVGARYAALVYGAPPAATRAGLAWQIMTVREESGVREAVPLGGLRVRATAGGHVAEWTGPTNADGIAEAALDLPGVHAGDLVEMVVEGDGHQAPLARGAVRWQETAWAPRIADAPWVPASKQEGDLVIDVAVYGQKLAPGFAAGVWARVRDKKTGAPVPNVALQAEPEPGLEVALADATTCANGWAVFTATARMHVVGTAIHAKTQAGVAPEAGEWFGALPVAPGGADVPLPTEAPPGAPLTVSVLVPTVRSLVYLEVDDASGRAFAASVPVPPGSDGRAEVTIPALAPGLVWVVTAGEPRGAETLEGAAIARPLLIREGEPLGRCELGPALAKDAGPFPKWLALDGTSALPPADRQRRRTGLALAWGALGVAGMLETYLLLRIVARARRGMARVASAFAGGEASVPTLAPAFGVADAAIGVGLALLGFALVGALLSLRAQ